MLVVCKYERERILGERIRSSKRRKNKKIDFTCNNKINCPD